MTTLTAPMSGQVRVQRIRTVRLYGKLGAKFGRVYKLAVASPAEAVQALKAQLEGFEAFLVQSKDMGLGYAVFAGKRNLSKDELTYPVGDDDIRIAPVILGSKSSGWLNIILGIALIAVSVMMMGADGGFFATQGGIMIAGAVMSAGVAMAVNGVVQLLMQQPKMNRPKERAEDTPSYGFSGVVNTMAQGHPVPLLYGRMIVGSAVISAGIEAKDEVYVPTNEPVNGGGGGGGGDRGNTDHYTQEM